MPFRFLNFIVDEVNQELLVDGREIVLSARSFQLLRVLVEHPGRVFSREALIEQVWPGRYVTLNALDQALSRLRRALAEETDTLCIETVFGKGIRFLPEVEQLSDPLPATGRRTTPQPRRRRRWSVGRVTAVFALIMAGMVAGLWHGGADHSELSARAAPILVLVDGDEIAGQAGFSTLLEQLIDLSGLGLTPSIEHRAPMPDPRQQVDGQWRVSPGLRVLASELELSDEGYRLAIELLARSQAGESVMIEAATLPQLLRRTADWLATTLDRGDLSDNIDAFLGEDDFLVESYMRGLDSVASGLIDPAATHFEACLAIDPQHVLARLELARMRYRQGRTDEALASLDALGAIHDDPLLQIEIGALKGDILDTRGDFEEASRLYRALLSSHGVLALPQLNGVRYNLHYSLAQLGQLDEALAELDALERDLATMEDRSLLPHVLQRQGSLLLQMARPDEAGDKARAALVLFDTLDDALSRAKTLSLMGRIEAFQGQLPAAEALFGDALAAAEAANYPLGIGASLNELIDVYIRQGRFTRALEANARMQQIAIEIDYAAMRQMARQHEIRIARGLGHWARAETLLDQHLSFAEASDNPRWQARNDLMRIELLLDQGLTEDAEITERLDRLLDWVIESGETRWQPAIEIQKIRALGLERRFEQALTQIQQTRELAQRLADGQAQDDLTALEASFLLEVGRAADAAASLARAASISDRPRNPDLLRLCARVHEALADFQPALECSISLQQRAHEAWTVEDQQQLDRLRDLAVSSDLD